MSRVLIVDDHTDTCRLMARIVRGFGHEAECVDGGAQALARLATDPADLVILDLMMPGMSGLDVLRSMRASTRTAAVPVIMFSAVADPAVHAQAIAAGANGWWTKASVDVATMERDLGRLASQSDA
ncbi:MAG TPA: response regulator [Tepidisphaeraceae bacterium]|nr:response regulator [Tepidisphaeraceae bacterium]